MKILRIKYEKIGLFDEGITLDLAAADRVYNDSKVDNIYGTIHTQRVLGIAGINASGKTMALRLIKFALYIILGEKTIVNMNSLQDIIKKGTKLTIDFFHNDKFYRHEAKFGIRLNPHDESSSTLAFTHERIYCKNKSRVQKRNQLYDFAPNDLIHNRSDYEQNQASFLRPNDSIVTLVLGDTQVFSADLLDETNLNLYSVTGPANMASINLFDDSIAKLKRYDDKLDVVFKSNPDRHKQSTVLNGDELLSSGTIKGGNLLYLAGIALKTGGYLLIDELENHMHKELVLTIMDFFNDDKINKKGATLIFTTHYAEILDSFDRKDNIYISLKLPDYTCKLLRFSELVKRNDLKKSEIFLSNFIKGTAPSYESIEKVREYLCKT